MRLRTVKQLWAELKAADSNCAVGLPALKAAVADGTIRSFPVGRRKLVDADRAIDELFSGGGQYIHKSGEVRKID